MIHATLLTAETLPRFIENIQSQTPMVCWVYYAWRDGEKSIDIARAHYRDGTEYFEIGCRGCGYFSLFADLDITKFPVDFWTRNIYSFIEMEKD
jgi:hypothetical protein